MSVIPSGNPALDKVRNAYTDEQKKKKEEKSDALGRDAFLTMLVAQLQNQDPLNPMEGADFSAQLAQFSQLEQLMDLNESMKKMTEGSKDSSGRDIMNYLGCNVSGNVNTINVENGMTTRGSYTLSRPADVKIIITNEDGETVRTLLEGQKSEGTEKFSWDGKDIDEKLVEDGKYKYTIMANFGKGYVEVPSTVSGRVEKITYSNDKPYLVVDGALMEPDSVTAIEKDPFQSQQQKITAQNIMDYLGKTVTTAYPQIQVVNGKVLGDELPFHMDTPGITARIYIYDENGEGVRNFLLRGDETGSEENIWKWDGMGDNGKKVPDGLYTYMIESDNKAVQSDVSTQVTGIKSINGVQFLELDNKRLVHLANIKGIQL